MAQLSARSWQFPHTGSRTLASSDSIRISPDNEISKDKIVLKQSSDPELTFDNQKRDVIYRFKTKCNLLDEHPIISTQIGADFTIENVSASVLLHSLLIYFTHSTIHEKNLLF